MTSPRAHAALASAVVAVVAVAALVPLPLEGAAAAEASPPVVDLHVDLSYRVSYRGGSLARGLGQYPASELVRAGVAGVVLPLFVPHDVSPTGPRLADLEGSRTRLLALLPTVPPYSLPGCEAKGGTVKTWFSFEGAAPLAGDRAAARTWVARGVRVFGFVHTHDNALATSSSGGEKTYGLSPLGRDLLHDVDAAGGVVDVSHASDATVADVLAEAAKDGAPVIATHSDARALVSNPRNLTDEQIRGIARTGGVVGVNFHSRFLVARGRATLADVVKHVLHLVRVAGAEHVAIGSDFEGDIDPPVGMESVAGFPRLFAALRRAGLSRDDAARVFGENALRLLCPPAAAPTRKP
ncbi:MAG TPA: membrane dipeptidase [Polyangiaceae bacterium]|nr:membrane dipeptidase [Polyangiaceae bacterium]